MVFKLLHTFKIKSQLIKIPNIHPKKKLIKVTSLDYIFRLKILLIELD